MPVLERLGWIGILLFGGFAFPIKAQLVVKLSPQTLEQFEQYSKKVESQLDGRWHGHGEFLILESDASEKSRVMTGELFIKRMSGEHPVAITDGLIHDWVGAIFIPHTTPERVVAILADFDHHKDFYPEVAQSKLLKRNGGTSIGFWRLEQKGLVPVKLDVTEEATYEKISAGRWQGRTYARQIIETDMSFFTRGRKFPPGEGHGYLWRLYAYWSLEATKEGVLAECRTLSLSRDIPSGLNWAVGPYVEKQPRASLASTLNNTRKAAE